MIHRMDPPADPRASRCPSTSCRCSPAPATLPADDERWALRDQVGRRARDRLLDPGRAAAGEPQPQRHHRQLSRARPPRTARSSSHSRDPRRRDRRLRRATAGPSFEALQRRMHVASRAQAQRLAASTPVTYMIFDLLWLDGHSLMELPYARAARAPAPRSSSTARAGGRPSTSSGTAERCWRRAPSRASRASSPSAWTRPTGPALRSSALAEDQDDRPPGVRHRRLAAGQGQAQRDASARCCSASTTRRARCATSGASAAASATPELERLARAAGAAARETARRSRRAPAAARRRLLRARARRRGRVQRVDARAATCATPPTRGCARTSPPRLVVREDSPARARARAPRRRARSPPHARDARGRGPAPAPRDR